MMLTQQLSTSSSVLPQRRSKPSKFSEAIVGDIRTVGDAQLSKKQAVGGDCAQALHHYHDGVDFHGGDGGDDDIHLHLRDLHSDGGRGTEAGGNDDHSFV